MGSWSASRRHGAGTQQAVRGLCCAALRCLAALEQAMTAAAAAAVRPVWGAFLFLVVHLTEANPPTEQWQASGL